MRFLALIVLLLPTFARADADIPVDRIVTTVGDASVLPEDRIRNARNCCLWAATDTIFYGAAGYEQCKGIFNRAVNDPRFWNGAGPDDLRATLERDKVPYETVRDFAGYKRVCDAGMGAVLFIPGHALALVGIDETEARVIDNNGPRVVTRWPIAKFRQLAQQGICPTCPSPSRPPRPNVPNVPGPPKPIEPVVPLPTNAELQKLLELFKGQQAEIDALKKTVAAIPTLDLKPVLDQLAELRNRPMPPAVDLTPFMEALAKLQANTTVIVDRQKELETRITHVEGQGGGRFKVAVTRVPQPQ